MPLLTADDCPLPAEAGEAFHLRVDSPRPSVGRGIKGEGIGEWSEGQRLRAWRARKETHGTEEAPNCPAARTARAKRVCRFNDKEKRQRQSGESDQLVVGHGKA